VYSSRPIRYQTAPAARATTTTSPIKNRRIGAVLARATLASTALGEVARCRDRALRGERARRPVRESRRAPPRPRQHADRDGRRARLRRALRRRGAVRCGSVPAGGSGRASRAVGMDGGRAVRRRRPASVYVQQILVQLGLDDPARGRRRGRGCSHACAACRPSVCGRP
jgi:hypothetical protein